MRALTALVLLLLLGAAAPAGARTITVTSTGSLRAPGDGACTLREALTAADTDRRSGPGPGECPSGQGADAIVLAPRATYLLTEADNSWSGPNGLPATSSDITVRGHGAVIEPAPGAPELRLFAVAAGHLSLEDLTLRGGVARGGEGGGAVLSRGFLTLERTTLSGNSALAVGPFGALPGSGGAVFNDHGTLIVANSTLSGNSAPGGRGGAVFNLDGPAVIANSTLAGNDAGAGGALYDLGSEAAPGPVGATPALVTLSNSILAGSPAGAGDLVSDQPAGLPGGAANVQTASVDASGPNIVEHAVRTGGGAIEGAPSAADPLLGPLVAGGGPGMATLAPRPGSPALGAGRGPECPRTDEQGLARPLGGCDLGAHEVDPITPARPLNLPRRPLAGFAARSRRSPLAGLRHGAPAGAFNPSGLSHCYELIPLRRPSPLRDLTGAVIVRRDGQPFLTVRGIVAVTRLEALRTPAGLTYQIWGPPAQPTSYSGGIEAAALTRAPTPLSGAARRACGRRSGRAAPDLRRHGHPVTYRIEPAPISARLAYLAIDRLRIPYQNYGRFYAQDLIAQAGVPAAPDYTPLSWSWVTTAPPCRPVTRRCRNPGGGIARAIVPRGTVFTPSLVQPIVVPVATDPRSWVAAVYGRVSSGRQRVYGWVVAAHHDAATGRTRRQLACLRC